MTVEGVVALRLVPWTDRLDRAVRVRALAWAPRCVLNWARHFHIALLPRAGLFKAQLSDSRISVFSEISVYIFRPPVLTSNYLKLHKTKQ